jgi:sulfoxide reductase heme-binding subunit YedZ
MGGLNLLLISLLVSPLAKWSKQAQLMKLRRPIGLYAFVYALVHLVSYILFELQLDWSLLISEVIKRPYITVGFAAFIILTLLAMTSTRKAQRKLGKKWQTLHNWVYMAAPLVALHFIWSVKSLLLEPIIYWLMLIFLLAIRYKKFSRLTTSAR